MAAVSDKPQVTQIHDGPVFAVERLVFSTERGQVVRDVVRHPGAVTVIGQCDDGEIVLIENHRVAVDAWLLEFCAGKREPGEAPQVSAARELREETGYEAESIEAIGRFYTSPGFADELMYVFLARGLRAVGQALEPGEAIRVRTMSPDAIDAAIDSGELIDGKSIAAWAMCQGALGRRV